MLYNQNLKPTLGDKVVKNLLVFSCAPLILSYWDYAPNVEKLMTLLSKTTSAYFKMYQDNLAKYFMNSQPVLKTKKKKM